MKDYLRFINDDTRLEILSRLSARDLQSLKCVSKEWSRVVSNRLFVHCQQKNAETVAGFFFQERFLWCDYDIERISYIPLESRSTAVHSTILNFLPKSVVILSSCNGLICCRCILPSPDPVIYVCNPINKEWISIRRNKASKKANIALSFESSEIPAGEALTDFKLVSVSESETEEDHFVFEIFSSKSGQWSRSHEICKCSYNLFKNKGISADGSLFWLTDGCQIIMFNPVLELSYLIAMPLPSTQFSAIPQMCIGESGGKLHYVLLSEHGIQLWVLVDHFDSVWDLRFSISLDELENENPEYLYNIADKFSARRTNDTSPWIDLLAFKDGILFTRVSTNVYNYNFQSRKMRILCKLTDLGMISMFSPIVVPYTMSFVPLDQV